MALSLCQTSGSSWVRKSTIGPNPPTSCVEAILNCSVSLRPGYRTSATLGCARRYAAITAAASLAWWREVRLASRASSEPKAACILSASAATASTNVTTRTSASLAMPTTTKSGNPGSSSMASHAPSLHAGLSSQPNLRTSATRNDIAEAAEKSCSRKAASSRARPFTSTRPMGRPQSGSIS